jgi:hypothetical protein
MRAITEVDDKFGDEEIQPREIVGAFKNAETGNDE